MPTAVTFEHYEVMTRDDGSLCELGRGAMGITYKGFDTRLRVPVALKVINAAHLHSDTARQRFIREARSAARLRHRNVASVFHLGEGGDNYFYAMEFIDGETVDARVKKHGPLTPSLVLKIGAQVARALNAAQTHDLVHRDIKPANLMLVHEDDELIVKVIDFGLAKVALGGAGEDAATLTMSGFLGTPHFARPEQLEEREIDVRSDIYSLGVTLWFALTGKTPFSGSVLQVMSQHITRQPPFEQLENIPAPVVELLRGMLDKNPAQRPQTALELRREIERCLTRIGDTADPSPDPVPVGNVTTSTVSESDETQFETGAAIGTRFIVTEQVGETEAGRVFRAHDGMENRDVRLLALERDLMADTEAIAQIESDAASLVALAHPNVLGIYGVTNDGSSAYLTMEWIDGFSLRDLLRARRELTLAEVLLLMPQAASGIDAALSVQSDRLVVTLPQLAVHFPDCQITTENLLRRPIAEWPDFQVKFNALPISRDRFSLTWDGAQTIVGKKRGPSGDDAPTHARIVHEFGVVVYEMLGGTPAAIGPQRYTPLASVDENGNELLRRAILTPASFASAADFVKAFVAPPEAAPLPPIRAAAATTTPESPRTEIRVVAKSSVPPAASEPPPALAEEPVVEPQSPPEIAAVVIPRELAVEPPSPPAAPEAPLGQVHEPDPPFTEPPPAPPSLPPEEPPAAAKPADPEPEVVIVSTPAPPELPPSVALEKPRARRPVLPYATVAILLMIAAISIYSRKHWPRPIVNVPPAASTTPIRTEPGLTPDPTPPAEPAPPTRMELANTARKAAEALEAKQETRAAFIAWLDLVRDFPEFPVGKVGLESFIGLLRNRPGGLPRAEFEAVREEITQAAKLDSLAAMLLLGEQLQRNEPAIALEWYFAAAKKGDALAMTQAARLLSIGVGAASDPGKVVDLLNKAVKMEEPNAMLALGQLHLSGAFGVKRDEPRAIELLQGAAGKGSTAALISLGDFYMKRASGGKSPSEKKDEEEAFRLFTEAAGRGNAEALGNLGVLYKKGAGVEADPALAQEKFKEASLKGDAVGMYYYAACLLEKRRGATPDPKGAISWFSKAAEKFKVATESDDPDSMYYYASSLEQMDQIDGTKGRLDEIKKWFREGAERGNQKAIDACKRLQIPFKLPPQN